MRIAGGNSQECHPKQAILAVSERGKVPHHLPVCYDTDMNYDGRDFTGVKAALVWNEKLLIYQRDKKPGLKFAGLWDFFGGGRENGESPSQCLVRELQEELEITILTDQVIFSKVFPAMHDPSIDAYFMVVNLTDSQAGNFNFGSEGIRCKFVGIKQFMNDTTVVPELKPRFASYLSTLDKNSQ